MTPWSLSLIVRWRQNSRKT